VMVAAMVAVIVEVSNLALTIATNIAVF